jgi:hypothetical protein
LTTLSAADPNERGPWTPALIPPHRDRIRCILLQKNLAVARQGWRRLSDMYPYEHKGKQPG